MTNNQGDLQKILRTRFNLDELRELCLYLEVNFEDLPGEALPRKALELVKYCQRRNRSPELIQRITTLRPDIESIGSDIKSIRPDILQDIPRIPEPTPEIDERIVLETQTGPLHITWQAQSDKWQLLVTNQGETKLESVFLVLRASTAVAISPNRLRIGTLSPGQTVEIGSQLIIRPRAHTSDAVCRLNFELIYPTVDGQQRKSDYLDIPL